MGFNALGDNERADLTLVMPVLDEGVRIIPTVCTLAFTVKVPLSLLIVYDHDDDTTLPVAGGLKDTFPGLKLVKNQGRGVIGAIRTGFDRSESGIVGVWVPYHVDPYGIVNSMFELVQNGGCDLVSGNRFNQIKRISRGSPMKKLLSRAGNFVLNRIIGIPLGDITTSLKLYKKSLLLENDIETVAPGGWALSTELAVKAAIKGYKLGEVEVKPENTNMIRGLSHFRVLTHLDQYLRWLFLGMRHRKEIKSNYRNAESFVRI